MHVGKRRRINLDGATEFLGAAIGVTDGFIRERAVLSETVHEPGDVFVLSYLVGLPNRCLVSGHMTVPLRKQICGSGDSKLMATAHATAAAASNNRSGITGEAGTTNTFVMIAPSIVGISSNAPEMATEGTSRAIHEMTSMTPVT